MFSRPQRKLYRLPLTVAALQEAAGGEEWAGRRDSHIALEEILEREEVKKIGARRDASGSGGRTHAALVRSLGLAFESNETNRLELTLAGEQLANGERPLSVLSNQVMRFQYPSPYSLGQNVNIDSKFKVRPFVLVMRLLLHPLLDGKLSKEEIAEIVIFEGIGDSQREADRVANLILEYRNGSVVEGLPRRANAKAGTDPSKSKGTFGDIANTCMNWLEVTGVVERAPKVISISESSRDDAQQLLLTYGSRPLIQNPTDEDRFQRSYGLPPGKSKDTRNLSASPAVSREDFVFSRVNTVLTHWSETELLINGATDDVVDRLVARTQFDHAEVEKAARKVLGTDRTLDSYLVNYQSLIYSSKTGAPLLFEKATAEIIKHIFKIDATNIGQSGREPDVLVRKPSKWMGIIDTKAYGGAYSLPSDHQRAMREYVEKYKAAGNDKKEGLAFWSFIAGAVSTGAGSRASDLSQQVGVGGSVVGILAWLKIIRLGQSGELTAEELATMLASGGEVTLATINKKLTDK